MNTVYCPVKENQINGTDCLLVCNVADKAIKASMLPSGINVWNEKQRKKCINCKYHEDIDNGDNK